MKLSVILPAYNAEKYIAEAIESILIQTFSDFEVILANDGSTDGTLSIMRSYELKDKRIVVLDSINNLGVGSIANKAIELSKGEWIARMDADDIMLPNRLEEQMKYLATHTWADVVTCWAYYINSKSKLIGKLTYPTDLRDEQDSKDYLTKGKIVHILQPGVIMRKAAFLSVGGYRPIVPSEDIDLWNRLIEKGYKISCMHAILMKYRVHENSITTKNYMKSMEYDEWVSICAQLRRAGEAEISFQVFCEEIEKKPFFARFHRRRKLYANYFYRNAAFLYGNQNYFGFVLSVLYSFLLDPQKIIGRISRQL